MSTGQHAGSGGASSHIPEPSLEERARTLVETGRIGALATHSHEWTGYPFASMMPYAVDDRGRPVIFISSMAVHAQNLERDMRASLLVTEPNAADDPLASARITLVGTIVAAEAGDVRDLYVARFEDSRLWQDFADFSYHRLEVAAAYFIGGFGVMGWLTAEEYASAEPDPLLAYAPGIIEHMNEDHAEALRRIVGRFGGEQSEEARMTSVDRLGFHVRVKDEDGFHGLRIAFPREARTLDEARAALVEMARTS